jgi:hypothetical protein
MHHAHRAERGGGLAVRSPKEDTVRRRPLAVPCAVLLAAACSSSSRTAPSAEPGFPRQLATAAGDMAGGLATDPAGNVVVAGTTGGALGGPSAGGNDVFVLKLDPSGRTLWARQLGGAEDELAMAAATDPFGNVLVAYQTAPRGGSTTGSFVAKLDPSGATSWVRELTATGDGALVNVSAVASDPSGNVLVAGRTNGVVMGPGVNAGLDDAFVVKLDPAGELVWRRQVGTAASEWGYAVTADGSGNVLLAGATQGSLFAPLAGSTDAFVLELDPDNHAFLWARQLGAGGSVRAWSVAVDGDANVLLTGNTDAAFAGTLAGGRDTFVVKLDPTAQTTVWARQLGTAREELPSHLALDASGSVLVTGSSCCESGVETAFVVKLDPDGVTSWTRTLGTASTTGAAGVATDAAANVFVAGSTGDDLFAPCAGGSDAFVVRYGPDGTRR